MSDINKKKLILKWIWRITLYGFAIAGFGIIAAWAIFNLGLTKNRGTIDKNNRYLMEIEEMGKINGNSVEDYSFNTTQRTIDLYKMLCISRIFPYNANNILKAIKLNEKPESIHQMIATTEMYINSNPKIKKEYEKLLNEGVKLLSKPQKLQNSNNAIEWMNTQQWIALKVAISKEKNVIDSAANMAGIEPRLIVATLIGEQIRLYNTNREVFKSYLGPVKVLVTETKFSMGVTGIKEFTAMRIEKYLKDPASEFYISKKYENVLDYENGIDSAVRIQRLTNGKSNYYSYLYAGIMLHQFQKQWERKGQDISYNAGVLSTLFNLGFNLSIPKPAPEIGGAKITINGVPHTFGGLAFDFYYSGELIEEFPYYQNKFID